MRARLFLDTEWADVAGTELISIAFVDESGEHRFYAEVDPVPRRTTDFARLIVVPLLERGWTAMQRVDLSTALRAFIGNFDYPQIVFDQSTDLTLLSKALFGFGHQTAVASNEMFEPALISRELVAPLIELYFERNRASARMRHRADMDAFALRWAVLRHERGDLAEHTVVLVGRHTDGWGGGGFVALDRATGAVELADNPAELVAKLEAARIDRDRVVLADLLDGDRGLSSVARQEFLSLLRRPG